MKTRFDSGADAALYKANESDWRVVSGAKIQGTGPIKPRATVSAKSGRDIRREQNGLRNDQEEESNLIRQEANDLRNLRRILTAIAESGRRNAGSSAAID